MDVITDQKGQVFPENLIRYSHYQIIKLTPVVVRISSLLKIITYLWWYSKMVDAAMILEMSTAMYVGTIGHTTSRHYVGHGLSWVLRLSLHYGSLNDIG